MNLPWYFEKIPQTKREIPRYFMKIPWYFEKVPQTKKKILRYFIKIPWYFENCFGRFYFFTGIISTQTRPHPSIPQIFDDNVEGVQIAVQKFG